MSSPISKDHNRFKSNVPEQTGIFPIMLRIPSKDRSGYFHFGGLGTGFFISKYGIFITAKHVVNESLEYQNGNGLESWIIINNENFTCPIRDLQLHPSSDIAIGYIVPPRRDGKPVPEFSISLCKVYESRADINKSVYSYGYPRTNLSNDADDPETIKINMQPDYYTGDILQYHSSGVSICRWPVYRHSMPTASGMSGGPLLLKEHNAVIGVNCTGDSTETEDINHGMATDIKEIFDMVVKAEIPEYKGRTFRDILKLEKLLI